MLSIEMKIHEFSKKVVKKLKICVSLNKANLAAPFDKTVYHNKIFKHPKGSKYLKFYWR